MQCATSKLADAVDTEWCREKWMRKNDKNRRKASPFTFPLMGKGVYGMAGRKESSVCLGMKGVEMGV